MDLVDDDRAPGGRRVSSAAVLATIFLCTMFGLYGLTSWTQWHAEQAKTDELVRVLSTAASEQIGGSLRSIDLLIQHVGQYVAANGRQATPNIVASLNIQARSYPEMAELLVVDTGGVARSLADGSSRDVAGRDFFSLQRRMFRANRVVLDGPLRDPVTGEWQVVLSRPRVTATGEFGGVVAAVLRPSFFADPLQSTGMQDRGRVLLVNVNRVVFGGFPQGEHWVGVTLPTGALPSAELGREFRGSFRNGGAIDGVDEITAYRAVPNYPLVVIAGIPVAAVQGAWWDGVWRGGAIVGFIGLVTVCLAVLFDWRDAQSRRASLALARLNEELESRVAERTVSLEQVKDAYENLFGGAMEGILIHRGFKPLLANQSCARLFGFDSVEEFLALPSFLDMVLPEAHAAVVAMTNQAVERLQPTTIEFEGVKRLGERFWCLNSIRPVEWQEGPAIQATFVNITASKSWQSQLSAAKEAAEAASELKSRFLAVACHDLRQPMQALVFYVNVLAQHVHEGEAAEIVQRIGESTDSLSALLNSLLDMSKLEAGKIKPVLRVVSLAEMLDRQWHLYCPLAEEAGVSLTVVPPKLFTLSDPVLLERILQNLITNALRYTPSGGKVLVGCRRRGPAVVVQVLDTGRGIPEDMLPRVFEEFFRLGDGAVKADGSAGLGLGLSIVQRLCRLMQHHLSVKSELGWGSVFSLELPVAEQGAESDQDAGPVVQQTLPQGRLVLVIDNNAQLRHSLELQLSDWGLAVLGVSSTAQAIEAVAARVPDIVLCDYRLDGGETGESAMAAVAEALGAWPRAILLTADTAPIPDDACQGFRVLHKPVRPDVLKAVLATELGNGEPVGSACGAVALQ